MTAPDFDQLVRHASHLVNSGRWDEAEPVWLEVRKLQPQHPQALFSLGVLALKRGDTGSACDLLRAARAVTPRDLVLLMTLATAWRELPDPTAEREAIEAALAVDAYFLPALLAKGSWSERNGTALEAALIYTNVLTVAPQKALWPESLRAQLEHALALVNRHAETYGAYLEQRLAAARGNLPPALAERWREAAAILSGRSKPFHSVSNQLYVPRIPALPFFDRADCPWVAALEAKTDVIRAELESMLQSEPGRFDPYIARKPGEPVNQWQELNHSKRWSVLHLWRGGAPVQEHLDRCPETARALAKLPAADIPGQGPNAVFSALAPHTHIPPHNGESNARLVAHLPLIVPDGCRFRVGFEERRWTVGQVLLFDDTIEHEAFNDSDELRVVLIFDVWNPLLTAPEREMVRAMTLAAREFRG
jgi:aspartyl/asparaginyl beta-hydroxylase (cupin superfamily)